MIKDVNSLHFSQAIAPWLFISHNFPCQQKHTKSYTLQSWMCFHASPTSQISKRYYAEELCWDDENMSSSVSHIATSDNMLNFQTWAPSEKVKKTDLSVEIREKHTTNTRRFQKFVLHLKHTLFFAVQGFRAAIFGIVTGDTHASQRSLDILVRSVHGIKATSCHLIWKLTNSPNMSCEWWI